MTSATDPKVGCGEAVRGGDVGGGGGGVGEVGVDVGQEVAHHRGNAWTHVLPRQTGEVAEERLERKGEGVGWAESGKKDNTFNYRKNFADDPLQRHSGVCAL